MESLPHSNIKQSQTSDPDIDCSTAKLRLFYIKMFQSDRLDGSDINTLKHPCAQIKWNGKSSYLDIPRKYEDLFLEHLDDDETIEAQPATQENWKRLQAIYVSSFWLDQWYDEESDLPTAVVKFYDWDKLEDDNALVLEAWKAYPQVPFVRMNSLSDKSTVHQQPFASLDVALQKLSQSERVKRSIELGELADRPMKLAMREWQDLGAGQMFRCVIFENQLKRVVPDDDRIQQLSDDDVRNRCEALYRKVDFSSPSCDTVMDVWLHDSQSELDQLIEFNSFGVIGNSHSDMIDWCDITLYL